MTPTRHDDGYVLIEILVAFAVLAITIIMSFEVLGSGVRRMVESELREAEMILARTTIDQLRLRVPIPLGLTRGEASGIRWELQTISIDEIQGQRLPVGKLVKVTFRASHIGPPQPEDIVLETIVQTKLATP